MKNSPLLPTLALVAAMFTNGCSRSANPGRARARRCWWRQAVETNVPVQIDPPPVGHVMPYSTVTIRPQIGGILSEVHFQEGQEVKKGDLLFTIDPRPAQAALARPGPAWPGTRPSWKTPESSSTASRNCSSRNWFRRMNLTPAGRPSTPWKARWPRTRRRSPMPR